MTGCVDWAQISVVLHIRQLKFDKSGLIYSIQYSQVTTTNFTLYTCSQIALLQPLCRLGTVHL